MLVIFCFVLSFILLYINLGGIFEKDFINLLLVLCIIWFVFLFMLIELD